VSLLAGATLLDPMAGLGVVALATMIASLALTARDARAPETETAMEAVERWSNAATALDRLAARSPATVRDACDRAAKACEGVARRLVWTGAIV
jgi:hypothetical protein